MLRAVSLSFLLAAVACAQEVVRFPGADGFELEARLVASSLADAPVAICLHQYRADKDSWKPLLPALQDAGFTALAIDQRAHGGSKKKGSETVEVEKVPRERFGELLKRGPEDVKAALEYLRKSGHAAKRVVLFGASYGCSVSLLSAAEIPEVEALVLLSPGEEYFGVDVRPVYKAWKKPLMTVLIRKDKFHETGQALVTTAHSVTEPRWTVDYPGEGHGTSLFAGSLQEPSMSGPAGHDELMEKLAQVAADPRKLIITWLAEAAKLGTAPRDARR